MPASFKGRLPSIPEYYRDWINKDVDLNTAPKQCCPFHKEDTPSFSYSADKKRWRCFGACHTGGDVIRLHMMSFKLNSENEAKKSLQDIYQVEPENAVVTARQEIIVDDEKISNATYMSKALLLACTPSRWLQLDQIMTEYPVDNYKIKDLVDSWENTL